MGETKETMSQQAMPSHFFESADCYQRRQEATRARRAQFTQQPDAEPARQSEIRSLAKRRCLSKNGKPFGPARVDMNALYKYELPHKPKNDRSLIVRLKLPAGKAWPQPKKKLLDMPLEIFRHISSYIVDDLHVQLRTRPDTAILVSREPWRSVVRAKRVSKRLNSLISEAIEWAGSQGKIDAVVDTTKPEAGWSQRRFRLTKAEEYDTRYAVPRCVIRQFSSVKIMIPVGVGIYTPRYDFCYKELVITLHQPADGRGIFEVVGCTWTTTRPPKTSNGWTLLSLAHTFDHLEEHVRRSAGLCIFSDNAATTLVRYIDVLVRHVIHSFHPSNGNRVIRRTTWWKEYKVLDKVPKLGWRGTASSKRINQQDPDEEEMTALPDWLAGLDVTAKVEAD